MKQNLGKIQTKARYILKSIEDFKKTFYGPINYKKKDHRAILEYLHSISDDTFHIWEQKYLPAGESIVITLNLSSFHPHQCTVRVSFDKHASIEIKPDTNSKIKFSKITGDHYEMLGLIQDFLLLFSHPESKGKEIYLGNLHKFTDKYIHCYQVFNSQTIARNFTQIPYETKRLGEVAYSWREGEKTSDMYPVFVSFDEWTKKITHTKSKYK